MVSCTADSTSRARVSTRPAGVSFTASNGDLSLWKRSVAEAPEAAAEATGCSMVVIVISLFSLDLSGFRGS